MALLTICKTYLPHFQTYSSTLIPARVAGVEPGSVLAHWESGGPSEPDDGIIELSVAPVFLHRGGTYELLNYESMQGFDARWSGLPPAMAQNPGALIRAYIVDNNDITHDQELILLSYFGDIEYRILPFSDYPWRPLVDQFQADPGTERLFSEHIFHTPSAQLSAGQMSRLFHGKVSEDSVRRYRKELPPRHAVSTVSPAPLHAPSDDKYEPTEYVAAAHSLNTTQTPDASAEAPVSAASAGETIEPADPVPDDEPPDKTSPNDEVAHSDAAGTGGDEHSRDPGDDEARPDAAPTEPKEPPDPTEPTESTELNHSGPTRGRRLLNPLKWRHRRMRDE
ncbi:hypothetical protein BA899_09725 [Spiribacter sp. SSL99]|uniref:hypothetical protein n=1 Tax=Spiribacter sp. SSL99 TaxID=1866884 RepID=UPI00132FA1B1|nr:hypothetical protein [Spiribacter sp. SSL99]KAF0286423.1 hypothetical protein BA899_09725 [Spiribacter sp. SSL99]